ncbi:hypothetical protein B0T25DRAFT_553806, partial [Lasiosphaeria hispida]
TSEKKNEKERARDKPTAIMASMPLPAAPATAPNSKFPLPLALVSMIADSLPTCRDILNLAIAYSGMPVHRASSDALLYFFQTNMYRKDARTHYRQKGCPALYWAIRRRNTALARRVAKIYVLALPLSLPLIMGFNPRPILDIHEEYNADLGSRLNILRAIWSLRATGPGLTSFREFDLRWETFANSDSQVDMEIASPIILAVHTGQVDMLRALLEEFEAMKQPWFWRLLNLARKLPTKRPPNSLGPLVLRPLAYNEPWQCEISLYLNVNERCRVSNLGTDFRKHASMRLLPWTAIEMAALLGRADMMRLLAQAGASVDIGSSMPYPNTLLRLCGERWGGEGSVAVLDYLLELGLDINGVNPKYPVTALQAAVRSAEDQDGNVLLVHAMIRAGAHWAPWTQSRTAPWVLANRINFPQANHLQQLGGTSNILSFTGESPLETILRSVKYYHGNLWNSEPTRTMGAIKAMFEEGAERPVTTVSLQQAFHWVVGKIRGPSRRWSLVDCSPTKCLDIVLYLASKGGDMEFSHFSRDDQRFLRTLCGHAHDVGRTTELPASLCDFSLCRHQSHKS